MGWFYFVPLVVKKLNRRELTVMGTEGARRITDYRSLVR
jgi:hypothetical protein